MSAASQPSDVARHLAAALDDNLNVPLTRLVEFELALANNPADRETRLVYRDWLLEHGCDKRAGQLADELEGKEAREYRGPVRPERIPDWAGY